MKGYFHFSCYIICLLVQMERYYSDFRFWPVPVPVPVKFGSGASLIKITGTGFGRCRIGLIKGKKIGRYSLA